MPIYRLSIIFFDIIAHPYLLIIVINVMIMMMFTIMTMVTLMMAYDVRATVFKCMFTPLLLITNVKIAMIILITKVMAVTVLVLGIYMLARRR